ncbi:arf-GAP with Rho-GAP domain, ANK repeat and PH domain-containing protein 3 isoform X2 [Ambystoma mexicanum]|uniref:arf-GAP with Rho-GAP domain, ANK repeat and PH domain-containing protein 3 isoform X2 n=1 Tax=Ambystoma mexicanum TaxID=8296 RepID=UPI0037E99C8C
MTSLCDEDLDIADWLSAIHLERYTDDFKLHGYHTAKDTLSLDNETLQHIGIIATGHRKRILSRLWHVSGRVHSRSSVGTSMQKAPAGLLVSPEDSRKDIHNLDIATQGTVLDSPAQSTKDIALEPLPKPVPKPRTVFPKSLPASKNDQTLTPTPVARTWRASNHQGSDSDSGFGSGDVTLDGLISSDGSTDHVENNATVAPLLKEEERRLTYTCTQDTPSERRRGSPSTALPHIIKGSPLQSLIGQTFTETALSRTSPPPSSPDVIGSDHAPRSPFPFCLPTSPFPETEFEMITNVIYDGSSPRNWSAGWPCSQEAQQSRTSASPLDAAREEGTQSLKKQNFVTCDQPVVPERSSTSLVDLDDDNPYCETVVNRSPQPPNSKAVMDPVRACSSVPTPTRAKEHEQQGNDYESCSDKKAAEGGAAQLISQILQNESEGYSTVDVPSTNLSRFSLPANLYPDEILDDLTISPYASFTSLTDRPRLVHSGWLDKLSPQGNYVFQRRFIRFDGKKLTYFNNDKELYPKGVIPLAVIEMARSCKDNKFEVVTSHRIFVFRAENEAQRTEWCTMLQNKVKEHRMIFPRPRYGSYANYQKSGFLELKGYKSKIFTVLTRDEVWLYKTEQFFKMGIGICVVEMQGSTIRDAKNKTFELITPQKIFSFTAESEREKKEWMESLLDSISETLSDYEVAEKIWSNKANKFCADCKAGNPDWASINLCVVICKQCAGQHRGLGTNVSKVQSLKLDISVWSNEIVQLFIILGNDRANRFWTARLQPSEVIQPDASAEQRRDFIINKYREGKYRQPHPQYTTQEEILQALCAGVAGHNVLKTMMQFFFDAESSGLYNVYDSDGSPSYNMDPWWMSENNSQRTVFDTTYPDDPDRSRVYDEIMQSVVHCGYLYKTPVITKPTPTKRTKDEFHRVWCSLERSLLFYESDKSSEPNGKIEAADIVCLAVSRADGQASPNPTDRFHGTFEIVLSSERVHYFGTDGADTLQSWTSAIGKWFSPLSCHCLLEHAFQRVGRLRYKAMLNPSQWKEGFFLLQRSHLFICPEEHGAAEDSVNLQRLQELTVATQTENSDKKEVLILGEKGRTFYLQGVTRLDFLAWCVDIQAAAGGRGNFLRDQQLSRNDIPIIVDSCIAFITQYGLRHEGIYRKNGAKSRIKLLMDEFRRDARNVKLRISDNFIEDVTDVLKRFFRELEDPIFTTELHPKWKEAAAIPWKPKRLERYMELINHLPRVNRTTLAALIGHLYRVQKCADLNQMCTKNLSLLFAPSLFQTDGKGEHEVKVMEDLIDNYVQVFNIEEDQVTQMDLENSLITTWKDVQLTQAGDVIIEVYLEQKLSDCCVTLKVSPAMSAEELTNQVLDMRNVASSLDIWLTFEAIENGELERPLHPKEKVLEQALQWCKLPEPSSAYLLVKKVPIGEGSCLFTGTKREGPKCGLLKCREEPPKLLGCKFQERYFVIRDRKLLLLKEKKSSRPEREWPLDTAKVYMGIRKKLKPPSQWGFTLYLDKQHLCLCCAAQLEMWDWITSILKLQHDDLQPVILRRRSASDLSKQKFGTMPLVPIRGDDTQSTMLSANQTLRRLHARRTLSMFFPMKVHQDSLEEQKDQELDDPVYEEVDNFKNVVASGLDIAPLSDQPSVPPVDRTRKPILSQEHAAKPTPAGPVLVKSRSLEISPTPEYTKSLSLDRSLCSDPPRFSLSDRACGPSPPKSVSLERNIDPSRMLAASARGQGTKGTLDLRAMPPLFFEPPSSSDSSKSALRKKSQQLQSPMNEKLIQELSLIMLKKSEPKPGAGEEQQVT